MSGSPGNGQGGPPDDGQGGPPDNGQGGPPDNGQGGPPDNGRGGGPGNGRGRGPPQRVREKFRRAKREDDGTISVRGDPIADLAEQVDFQNLSLFEEYVLAVLVERGLLDENPSTG